MRRNVYRGKSCETGEWVEGFRIERVDATGMTTCCRYDRSDPKKFTRERIVPETAGEWTGFKDGNGRKIFEGDVVSYPCGFGTAGTVVKKLAFNGKSGFHPFVSMDEGMAVNPDFCLVIGNAFDRKKPEVCM